MEKDHRLHAVFNAAERLFVQKGYQQTQISDIAKTAGMATGTIYHLFSGKRALFQFVLQCVFDKEYLDRETALPLGDVPLDDLKRMMIKNVGFRFGVLFQDDFSLSFPKLLSLAYDFIDMYGAGFLIFERCFTDWKELSEFYFDMRSEFFIHFGNAVKHYIQTGEIRKLSHVPYHTRMMIETIAWWGMHVKYDIRDVSVSCSDAKAVAMDVLTHAYSTE